MPRLRTYPPAEAAAPGPRPPAVVYLLLWAAAFACAAFLARPAFGQSAARFSPTPTPTSPAGTRATVDLPTAQHMRNVGGSDGAGLCVFTSIQHAAYWQGVNTLDGFREWMRRRPGGGWPGKVDQMLSQFCREKGIPVPDYVQHTGGDDAFLELALLTDRMPSVTYDGRDDFYRSFIYHMVNLAHMDATRAAIIDNNRPGVWLWMTRADFLNRWRGSNGGWAVVLLAPPPPPHATTPATAAPSHEWVGTGAAPADLAAGCRCGGAGPCECGPGCKCAPAAGPVFGQCANGYCRPAPQPYTPGPPAPEPDPPFLAGQGKGSTAAGAWVRADGGGYGYWIGNRRAYDLDAAGAVRNCDARGWPTGDPIAPPVELPAGVTARPVAAAASAENVPPGGVVPHMIHTAPAYSMTGRPCTQAEAHAAIGAGGLADDSNHWHVTAVGNAALCEKVRADVAALPEAVRGKLLVQCYTPAAWPVAAFGLSPGVSLRAPSPGRVAPQLGAVGTAEYTAGVTKLADLLSVAGGPTPAPPKAPTPAPPTPSPTPGPGPTPGPPPDTPSPAPAVPPWVMILGALLLLILGRR